MMKPVDKYKSNESKRISAGADKKRKIKHRELKHNHKDSKNRKEELQDVKKLGNEQKAIGDTDKSKNKKIPPDIQEKSSDSSRKRVGKSKGKLDSRIDKAKKSEVKDVQLAKCSKSNSMKDSAEVKKSKKESIKKDKKSAVKPAKIAGILEKFAETSDKNKAERITLKQKGVNKSGKGSENISESEKKEKKKTKKVSQKKDRDFKIPVESAKSSGKIKVKNLILKEKDKSTSEKEPESVTGTQKTEAKEKSEIKKGKRRDLSEDHYESEKVRNKKKAGKHGNTSKSTSEQCKIKKHKIKKVKDQNIHQENKSLISEDESKIKNEKFKLDREAEKSKGKKAKKSNFVKDVNEVLKSESEKESKKTEGERKLSSRRKSGTKLLKDQGREDKLSDSIKITKRSISTSTTSLGSSVISSASPLTPVMDISISPATTISSPSLKKPLATATPITKNGMPYGGIEPTDEKIGLIGKEKKEQERIIMITKPPEEKIEVRRKQDDVKRNEVLESNKIYEGEIDSLGSSTGSTSESKSSEEEENEIEKKEVINKSGSSNVTFSGSSNVTFSSTDNNDQSTNSSFDVEQNEQNESQDQSYINGLAQIRIILEIYGMEKEKTEAFNKLLDEDVSMSEKEIAENLTKAVSDLPMNTELLQKVLKKMRYSGLLRKKEYEMLRKNLVPQAINESVTIALLAQVLQRQKLKKSTS